MLAHNCAGHHRVPKPSINLERHSERVAYTSIRSYVFALMFLSVNPIADKSSVRYHINQFTVIIAFILMSFGVCLLSPSSPNSDAFDFRKPLKSKRNYSMLADIVIQCLNLHQDPFENTYILMAVTSIQSSSPVSRLQQVG